MTLERTRFNKYLQPKYTYIQQLNTDTCFNLLNQNLYHLYYLLIKNGGKHIQHRFLSFLTMKLNEFQVQSHKMHQQPKKLVTKSMACEYDHPEFSIKFSKQYINMGDALQNLRCLMKDINNLDNKSESDSSYQMESIGEALRLLISEKILIKKKMILFEAFANAFGYKPTVDKRYVSNIFGFEDTGLFKFTVQYSKFQKKFYYLKQELQFAVSGLNPDEVFENNFSKVVLNHMVEEDESIVNNQSQFNSESFEESEVLIRNSNQIESAKDAEEILQVKCNIFNESMIDLKQEDSPFLKKNSKMKKSKSISANISPMDTSNILLNSCNDIEKIQLNQQIINASPPSQPLQSDCETSFIENQGDQLIDQMLVLQQSPIEHKKLLVKDEDSTNFNNSGKSSRNIRNNLLKSFVEDNAPVQGDQLISMITSRYVHKNWHEKQIEIDLTEQDKIMPLGYEIKVHSKGNEGSYQALDQLGNNIETSQKIKRRRSKSFCVQQKSIQLMNQLKSSLKPMNNLQNIYDLFSRQWDNKQLIKSIHSQITNRLHTG